MPIFFSPSTNRDLRARGAGVTAVLGPTNTGKTHLAIERMLAHSSGVIGLPLRLLAREVYNRAVERVGAEAVALVTGEEKIKPANPRFWVATVEAMPRDLDVAFLAVDEIQLAADFERGHVFTDRVLHRRGREETLVLGAATMRPIVERLLPGVSVVSRPRLSQLSFAGEKKITRLPRRSAIVAFSAEEVYAVAELIRRQRGGAAVVLGALSPRTRNAQVALYQAGEEHSRAAARAANELGDRINLLGRKGDDGRATRQPREFLLSGKAELRQPRAADDADAGQDPFHDRPHRRGAEHQRLLAAPPVQHAIGEDVAALKIRRKLDLVDGEEGDIEVARHRFDGGNPIARIWRLDLLLAGDERHGVGADPLTRTIVDFARQEPQRQADHARRVRQHPLDGEMRLAGICRPEHGSDAGAACAQIAISRRREGNRHRRPGLPEATAAASVSQQNAGKPCA